MNSTSYNTSFLEILPCKKKIREIGLVLSYLRGDDGCYYFGGMLQFKVVHNVTVVV